MNAGFTADGFGVWFPVAMSKPPFLYQSLELHPTPPSHLFSTVKRNRIEYVLHAKVVIADFIKVETLKIIGTHK